MSKGFAYMFNNKKSEKYIERLNEFTVMTKVLALAKHTINSMGKKQIENVEDSFEETEK